MGTVLVDDAVSMFKILKCVVELIGCGSGGESSRLRLSTRVTTRKAAASSTSCVRVYVCVYTSPAALPVGSLRYPGPHTVNSQCFLFGK